MSAPVCHVCGERAATCTAAIETTLRAGPGSPERDVPVLRQVCDKCAVDSEEPVWPLGAGR
jgi:hypothetical protein